VFYLVHIRLWALAVRDARGRPTLWVGGTSNKNRDVFEEKFQELVKEIQAQLQPQAKPHVDEPVASLAGD
jgi:hypothetical protein